MDRRSFLASLGSAACSPAVAKQLAPPSPAYVPHLEEFIPAAMQRYKTLGVSVALVDGNRIGWARGFGFSDHAQTKRVTPASVFSLQSISKTYTATLFLIAVDRGWFRIDDPLVAHMPEFRVNSRFGADNYRNITLRQLLSHWSGLTHEAPIGNNYDTGECTFDQHIASIADTWLIAPPGSRYAYSNLGFDLLAHLIEMHSGGPIERFAQKELFGPLGMRNTTYAPSKIPETNLVRGQQEEGGDVTIFIPMLGAGGAYSTASDMARFMMALMSNTPKLLKPATARQMCTPQFLVDHQVSGYGFGLFSRPAYGATMLSHGGGGYGYDTEQRWLPAYRMGVAVLTNDGDGGLAEEIADEALKAMVKARYGAIPANKPVRLTERPAVTPDLAAMKALEGSYRAYSGMRKFAVVDGALHYRVGTNDLKLIFRGNGEYTTDDERFRFHLDEAGRGASIEDLGSVGVDTFLANELAGEPPGPGKPEWAAFAGDYEGRVYGSASLAKVELRNGYLFISSGGGSKLIEYKPGFFFTSWGETVTFANDAMLYGNRRFVRVKAPSKP